MPISNHRLVVSLDEPAIDLQKLQCRSLFPPVTSDVPQPTLVNTELFVGELGLTGEIWRKSVEQRITKANYLQKSMYQRI